MPNQHENLILKLFSIGLSHDLTQLEHMKYTKASNNPDSSLKWSKDDYVAVHRKMFMALTTLGFIINDYSLRRLCIQAASTCEPETTFCKTIIEALPESNIDQVIHDGEIKETLLYLREQLETFQSAIKMNIGLADTWEKSSILCYESLDFLHRRVKLSEELAPLEYPGVEKFLKRNRMDSTEEEEEKVEVKPILNVESILEENKAFATSLSQRMRQIKNPFKHAKTSDVTLPSEVRAVMIKTLQQCPHFEIDERGQIFMKLTADYSLNTSKSYMSHWNFIDEEQKLANQPNVFFDFNINEENEKSEVDVPSMHQDGHIRVHQLLNDNINVFEVETVMLYTLGEKKKVHIYQDFAELNKNDVYAESQGQLKAYFHYMMFRPQPEGNKLTKIVNRYSNMMEFSLDIYKFDATPGKFRFIKKNKNDTNLSDDFEMNGMDSGTDETRSNHEGIEKKKSITRAVTKTTREPTVRPPKEATIKIPKEPTIRPPKAVTLKPPKEAKLKPPKETTPKQPKKPIRSLSQSSSHKRKEQAVTLENDEKFHAKHELIDIMLKLQDEMEQLIGEKVYLDLSQMMDASSPHKVGFTYPGSTYSTMQFQKRRNIRQPMYSVRNFHLNCRMHGNLVIVKQFTDDIIYDENDENPWIQSSAEFRISGQIAFDHMSHFIKNMDIDCKIGDLTTKLKVQLRSGSRSKKNTKTKEKESEKAALSNGSCSGTDDHPSILSTSGDESITAFMTPTKHNSQSEGHSQSNTSGNETLPSAITTLHDDPLPMQQDPYEALSPTIAAQTAENSVIEINDLSTSALVHDTSQCVQSTEIEPEMTDVVMKEEPTGTHQHSSYQVPESYLAQQIAPSTPVNFVATSVIVTPDRKVPSLGAAQLTPSTVTGYPETPPKVQIIKIENVSPQPTAQNGNTLNDAILEQDFVQIKQEIEDKVHDASDTDSCSLSTSFETVVDFETKVPGSQVMKPSVLLKLEPLQEQTPPASPPFLSSSPIKVEIKEENENVAKNSKFRKINVDLSAQRILDNTPPGEVIDLTDEPVRRQRVMKKPCPAWRKNLGDPLDIAFVSCETKRSSKPYNNEMLTSGVLISKQHVEGRTSSALERQRIKNHHLIAKTHHSRPESGRVEKNKLHCEVRLVDCMKHINTHVPKKIMDVRINPVNLNHPTLVSIKS